jgi:hypothetical protein
MTESVENLMENLTERLSDRQTEIRKTDILLIINPNELNYDNMPILKNEFEYIKTNFCGTVIEAMSDSLPEIPTDVVIYMCGRFEHGINKYTNNEMIFVISEFSFSFETSSDRYMIIDSGRVPINIYNIGIYFRGFFGDHHDLFQNIKHEHKFQNLTDSNKPSNAFRKGIYLSKVSDTPDGLEFNLLRCSSNLSGPTDNFRQTDLEIIYAVNTIRELYIPGSAELNHVLAQIYENTILSQWFIIMMNIINWIWIRLFGKEYYNVNNPRRKAKISCHSDKTKDMSSNGVMAFCTFYDSYYHHELDGLGFNDRRLVDLSTPNDDLFDYHYKNVSALTQIHFRLKDHAKYPHLVKEFKLKMYPNSVLLIPLSTNRLYTHEIRPSAVEIGKMPTRMGYVIRCSDTKALYSEKTAIVHEYMASVSHTFLIKGTEKIPLIQGSSDDIKELKDLYYKENATDDEISYGDFHSRVNRFSLNQGDYMRPML